MWSGGGIVWSVGIQCQMNSSRIEKEPGVVKYQRVSGGVRVGAQLVERRGGSLGCWGSMPDEQ